MKKIIMLAVAASLVMPFTAFSENNITVKTDGNVVNFPDAKPYVDENSRTLVPVRFISESLGGKVSWDEKSQAVTISKGKLVKLAIGSKKVKVDEKEVELDTMPVITESRTFVPLRFVSEAFGATVTWDGATKTVNITTVKDDVDYKALADMIRQVINYEVDEQYDKVYDYLNPEDLAKKGLTRTDFGLGIYKYNRIGAGFFDDLRGTNKDLYEVMCKFKKNSDKEIRVVYSNFAKKKYASYYSVRLLHKINDKWYIDTDEQNPSAEEVFKYDECI